VRVQAGGVGSPRVPALRAGRWQGDGRVQVELGRVQAEQGWS